MHTPNEETQDMSTETNPALAALRYHVSGAAERGEAEPIIEQTGPSVCEDCEQVAAGTQRDCPYHG